MFFSRQVSSLQRVFLDGACDFTDFSASTALLGERFSYQIAYKSDSVFLAEILIKSELKPYVTIRSVENVPSENPIGVGDSGFYERTQPGLFPDVLSPIGNKFLVKKGAFHALWITVELPTDIEPKKYPITVTLSKNGEAVSENTFELDVIDAVMPKQQLIYTQWFHCDCIANYYDTPVFSERFWCLTESFIRTAVHTGVNMLLTPIFTPPLDTAVGGERLTVQLVDVYVSGKNYRFGFEKLTRWIRLAKRCGIEYFEISHLFSQWGAVAAPKIIANVNGESKSIFGWGTKASGRKYSAFLRTFLPELINVLKAEGIESRTFFHISDEPNSEQLKSYSKAKATVAPLLDDFPIIDALSDYEFYKNGIISHPIPCTDKIEEFISKGFEKPWTYYCCGQGGSLSNRFFGMPLAVTRAIGLQFFKFDIEGFLQWGYNFYNTQYSLAAVDPYRVTDAGGAFPSGDSFTVYPGKNGAIESVRSVVFYEALQDMRALTLLSSIIGKQSALNIIENKFDSVTFKEYPRKTSEILELRQIVNRTIKNSQ